MLLAYRLVRLIETHSEELAGEHLQKLQACTKCGSYTQVSAAEARQTVADTYRHLGAWLLGKDEREIEPRYRELGRRRAQQGVPLAELMWAIALVKQNLVEFLQRQAMEPQPAQLQGELEIVMALERFFDCASYYAALGYEQVSAPGAAAQASI
jgi:hypothetical protein